MYSTYSRSANSFYRPELCGRWRNWNQDERQRAAQLTLLENATTGQSASGAAEREHRLRLADGRTLACLELGDPAGPPVLYFHGFPGSRLEARVAAEAATRLGVRLLAVDRPGFGQSTFQAGRTVRSWAADVAALADQVA